MYTKFELPNKKIKTMGKKARKKSVNPKKTPQKKERADSSSRCFLKTRRSQTQICELSYSEINFPKLRKTEQQNRSSLAPLLFTALRVRPLLGRALNQLERRPGPDIARKGNWVTPVVRSTRHLLQLGNAGFPTGDWILEYSTYFFGH
jgi:hypothetical protein